MMILMMKVVGDSVGGDDVADNRDGDGAEDVHDNVADGDEYDDGFANDDMMMRMRMMMMMVEGEDGDDGADAGDDGDEAEEVDYDAGDDR